MTLIWAGPTTTPRTWTAASATGKVLDEHLGHLSREIGDARGHVRELVELLAGLQAVEGTVPLAAVASRLREALSAAQAVQAQVRRAGQGAGVVGEGLEIVDAELARLRQQALRDPLTRLANRRALNTLLPKLLSAAARRGERVAFALLDVDRFKKVNDELGHDVGDQVLVHVAQHLEASVREGDLVARFGGEEFVVVLRGIRDRGLRDALERLRHVPMPEGRGLPARIRMSVGVTAWTPGRTVADLVHRADQALLQAKRTGRDRIVSDQSLPILGEVG